MTETLNDDLLIEIMSALKPADLSVLEAAASRPLSDGDVTLMTAPGSANEMLWTRLAARGLMKAGPVEPLLPESRIFLVPAAARPSLKALFDKAIAQAAAKRERVARIARDVCLPFSETLMREVAASGGGPNDVLGLLAITMQITTAQVVEQGGFNAAIDAVAQHAKATMNVVTVKTPPA